MFYFLLLLLYFFFFAIILKGLLNILNIWMINQTKDCTCTASFFLQSFDHVDHLEVIEIHESNMRLLDL